MAAERAGGKTQLSSLVASGAGPRSRAPSSPRSSRTCRRRRSAAIVVVAIANFLRVDELRRFAHLRTSAIVLAVVALARGARLRRSAGLDRRRRPLTRHPDPAPGPARRGRLARDPATGAWARVERHPDWETTPDVVVTRVDGPLFYANATVVKEQCSTSPARRSRGRACWCSSSERAPTSTSRPRQLAELADELAAEGIELRLAGVRAPARELLRRGGLLPRLRVETTLDAASRRVGAEARPHKPLSMRRRMITCAMPKTIQIRDVDDEVYAALARRAAEAGITVPDLLRREAARLASRPTVEEWLARTRRRLSGSRGPRSSTPWTSCEGPGRMLIVDASCLYEVVVDGELAEDVRLRLTGEPDQAAPHIIDGEVLGVVRRDHLLGKLDRTAARRPWRTCATGRASASAIAACSSERGSCATPFARGMRSRRAGRRARRDAAHARRTSWPRRGADLQDRGRRRADALKSRPLPPALDAALPNPAPRQ